MFNDKWNALASTKMFFNILYLCHFYLSYTNETQKENKKLTRLNGKYFSIMAKLLQTLS